MRTRKLFEVRCQGQLEAVFPLYKDAWDYAYDLRAQFNARGVTVVKVVR